ncbi:transketolase family protein [Patescibacteria group bacterium]|nr:transketolase family protein [Patescibacteria group bacterium]MCG2687411.1 transketolase family protein [Candidatus Parcubacteria bacterium]
MSILDRGWKNKNILKHISTRNGFGEGLVKIAEQNKNVYVLCADLTESTQSEGFKTAFPDRFVQIGVSEQSLCAIGAGMCLAGKTVFLSSYAAFSPGRNWEQIRTTACLQKQNVKIVGSHAGVSVGPDGATHQMTEDIALMRVLPNMTVLVPCDAIEAQKITIASAKKKGPVYIRLDRSKTPVFTTKATPFAIGKAQTLRKGNNVAIIGCGPILYECLMAAEELSKLGIEARVINNASVKPMDEATIIKSARECGAIVTAEDAQIAGGMGSAVCELLAEAYPVPIERIGMQDEFGQSGNAEQLLEHYKLTAPWIIKAAQKVIKRK